MNSCTGEIREFLDTEAIPKGWVSWDLEEIVQVKGCYFKIAHIDKLMKHITLRAISKKEGEGGE